MKQHNIFFYLLVIVTLVALPDAIAQVSSQSPTGLRKDRATIVPQTAPFEANEAQLQAVLKKLDNVLTCKETFEDLEGLFMSENETLEFLQTIGQEHAEHAVPFFMNLSKQLKEAIKPYYSQTKTVKLIYHRQRYGTNEMMKVVSIGINIIQKDETPVSMRIQMLEYKDGYRFFSLDS